MQSQRWMLTGLASVLMMAGCGVGLDDSPLPIPPGAVPTSSPPSTVSPSPTTTPARAVRVWFVLEDGLVPVVSELAAMPTVDPSSVLQALSAGPNSEDAERGLRTVVVDPISDSPLVAVPAEGAVTDIGSVVVVITSEVGALPPGEQVLMLGQVVLSLTGAGYSTVTFVDAAGVPAAVPLPGGRLLDRPAVARDYSSLIIEL